MRTANDALGSLAAGLGHRHGARERALDSSWRDAGARCTRFPGAARGTPAGGCPSVVTQLS